MISAGASRPPAAILLVDSDVSSYESTASLLKGKGYVVVPALNLASACGAVRHQDFDLIITDSDFPDGTGLELLRNLKELKCASAVIFRAINATVRGAVEAIRQGACDYILKSLDYAEFLSVVENLLEGRYKQEQIAWKYSLDNMASESNSMQQLKTLASRAAATDVPVLITGEAGTGKELLARTIHYHSARRTCNFVPVDFASRASDPMKSEISGHNSGIRPSSASSWERFIDEANGGTIFFDEVGNIPLVHQAQLMSVLQEPGVRPISSVSLRSADFRIMATTNKNLATMVTRGTFREDLYYRLNVLPLQIPPLRARTEDIPVLVNQFIRNEMPREIDSGFSISTEAMQKLISHHWPGNVLELENTVKRALALCHNKCISVDDIVFVTLAEAASPTSVRLVLKNTESGTLEDSLKQRIESSLHANNWNFSRTASQLGIGRTTLWRKIKKYNITKDEKSPVYEN